MDSAHSDRQDAAVGQTPATGDDLALRGVLHDVNQLLGVITGRVQLLLKQSGMDDRRRDLEAIALAATDAGRILSRMHTGAPALQATARLEDIIRQACRMIQPPGGASWRLADATGDTTGEWSLVLSVVPDLVSGVPPHILREVLNNLLTNALAVLPEGGRVSLTAEIRAGRVLLSVEDSGPGIAAAAREAIFALGETSSGDPGRGVGLPASRALLAAYGGRLDCIEPRSGGAAFRLDLPPADLTPTEIDATAVDAKAPRPRRGRVLVVDDDPATRDMLTDVLEDGGQEVTAVRDAPEALAAFAAGTYEVAFMDLKLPGVSGLELAAQLRRRDAGLATVLITGWNRPEDLAALEDPAGPIDLVGSKPLALDTIQGLLAEAQLLREQRAGKD